MNCPSCNSSNTKRNGTAKGRQRWKCNGCGRNFLEPSPNPPGRPLKGDKPMIGAERMRELRARRKLQPPPIHERRSNNNKKRRRKLMTKQATELFSISDGDQGVSIFIGETELSGVPSVDMAERFVSAAKDKGWDEELLLNTDSRRVGLVGGVLINSLIEELQGS